MTNSPVDEKHDEGDETDSGHIRDVGLRRFLGTLELNY